MTSSALFLGRGNRVASLKRRILGLATKTKRGLIETDSDREQMRSMFEEMEKLNPYVDALSCKYTSGTWSLEYTTSSAILGRGGTERVGPILQMLDTNNLRAANSETLGYFGGALKVKRKVRADLKPVTKSLADVRFREFSFFGGDLLKVPLPEKTGFTGTLDVTYIDQDFRLSRGDKGNIFVLTKFNDNVSVSEI